MPLPRYADRLSPKRAPDHLGRILTGEFGVGVPSGGGGSDTDAPTQINFAWAPHTGPLRPPAEAAILKRVQG